VVNFSPFTTKVHKGLSNVPGFEATFVIYLFRLCQNYIIFLQLMWNWALQWLCHI